MMLRLTTVQIRHALDLYDDLPYHGRHHPTVVLAAVYRLAQESAFQVPTTVVAAALLHDAGYVVGASDNEERAALMYVPSVLHAWPAEAVEHVSAMVLATKSHVYVDDVWARLLCDADMDGFSAPWDEFQANNAAIEREYLQAGVAPEAYAAGRQSFLEATLDDARHHSLYHFGRPSRRTAVAIDNLERLLEVQ